MLGAVRAVAGGPFAAYRPPAVGVCLDAANPRAAEAAILLDIPDFTAPSDAAFADLLGRVVDVLRADPAATLYVGCRAGIGRTGMVLAGLARLAGIEPPIPWVRAHYHPAAVETEAQARAVAALDVAAVLARYGVTPASSGQIGRRTLT